MKSAVWIVLIGVAGTVGLSLLLYSTLTAGHPWRGTVMQESVSPDRQFRAVSYDLNPGAFGSEYMRIEVASTKSGARPVNVYYDEPGDLSWLGGHTLRVHAYDGPDTTLDLAHPTHVPIPVIHGFLASTTASLAVAATLVVWWIALGLAYLLVRKKRSPRLLQREQDARA